MDWQVIIAVSEVLGAIGVIVSLVYVGKQLRMSNLAAEAASTDQITHRFLQWMLELAGNDKVARFFARRCSGTSASIAIGGDASLWTYPSLAQDHRGNASTQDEGLYQ